MNTKKTRKVCYVDFKNEHGDIRNDLLNAVTGIEGNITELYEFLSALNYVMMCCYDNSYIKIFNILAGKQPYIKFKIIYYVLEMFTNASLCLKDLDYLNKFVDEELDVFMIANYLKEKTLNKDEIIALECGI